jgi:hypothetical protein
MICFNNLRPTTAHNQDARTVSLKPTPLCGYTCMHSHLPILNHPIHYTTRTEAFANEHEIHKCPTYMHASTQTKPYKYLTLVLTRIHTHTHTCTHSATALAEHCGLQHEHEGMGGSVCLTGLNNEHAAEQASVCIHVMHFGVDDIYAPAFI